MPALYQLSASIITHRNNRQMLLVRAVGLVLHPAHILSMSALHQLPASVKTDTDDRRMLVSERCGRSGGYTVRREKLLPAELALQLHAFCFIQLDRGRHYDTANQTHNNNTSTAPPSPALLNLCFCCGVNWPLHKLQADALITLKIPPSGRNITQMLHLQCSICAVGITTLHNQTHYNKTQALHKPHLRCSICAFIPGSTGLFIFSRLMISSFANCKRWCLTTHVEPQRNPEWSSLQTTRKKHKHCMSLTCAAQSALLWQGQLASSSSQD
jgi:hypothetical protein